MNKQWKLTNFIFLCSKITADDDCSHKIKRCLLLGRKAMSNLDCHIIKLLISRVITLLTNICIVKAMVFPVVMYGCDSWTIKKGECQKTDTSELWCWRRLLKVHWTEINYSGFCHFMAFAQLLGWNIYHGPSWIEGSCRFIFLFPSRWWTPWGKEIINY